MRAVIASSPPAWTSDCTADSTSLRRMEWSSTLSGDSSVMMDLHWPCSCTAQSSILSIGSVAVALLCRHFPERSWAVVAFRCFPVVMSFTSWYVLIMLFFLRFSSIFLHFFPIQFSLGFFMLLLMLLFTSLYFSDPSGSDLFFLSSLLLSHRSGISAVTQVFFVLTMFAKDLNGCFSHCCVEGGDL